MKLTRSEQARVNGAKSHGPITNMGKERSSLNALKHDRYATHATVLANEDVEAFNELVASCVRRIQPTDPVEYNLAGELAAIEWRLTRTVALGTRSLDHEIGIQSPAFDAAGMAVPQLTRVMTADRGVVERSPYLSVLARREAQLIRSRRAVLNMLRDLRKYFPAADPAIEVIPPVPLNPDLPIKPIKGLPIKPIKDLPIKHIKKEASRADSVGRAEHAGPGTDGLAPIIAGGAAYAAAAAVASAAAAVASAAAAAAASAADPENFSSKPSSDLAANGELPAELTTNKQQSSGTGGFRADRGVRPTGKE